MARQPAAPYHPMEVTSTSVQRPTTFEDVEDAVLELIFASACTIEPARHAPSGMPTYRHVPAIPRVCRRWAAVYTQSSLLWDDLRVDWSILALQAAAAEGHGARAVSEGYPLAVQAAAGPGRAIAARLPYARRLWFRGCCALASASNAPLPLGQIFQGGLSSARLREVHILGACGIIGPSLPAVLQRCTGLQSIELGCMHHAEGPESALVLQGDALAGLSCLPDLASLKLFVDKIVGSTAELARALPGLTHLSIRCRMESAALAPELLEGLNQLRRLELENVRLAQFTPRLAQALSKLTHLSCCDVLAAQPRRRSGVQLWQGLRHLASLQELRLERQDVHDLIANALACRNLRGLTLVSSYAQDWPRSLSTFTGEGGCLGRLASLHLESLLLQAPIPPPFWVHLAGGLTKLTWRTARQYQPPQGLGGPGFMQAAVQARFRAAEVPGELAGLSQLRELRLEYAQLESVPPAVQALTQLSALSLEGNRISALPLGQYLAGLRKLSLANNSLAEGLPDGLMACSSLEDLSLVENNLSVSGEAAEQLDRSLPLLRCLRISLPLASTGGAGTAAAAGQADVAHAPDAPPHGVLLGAVVAAAAAVGQVLGGGGQPQAADQAGAEAAAAEAAERAQARAEAHIEAMRHLMRAFGERLQLER